MTACTERSRVMRRRGGFSITEMLVYTVIAGVVLLSVYKLMTRQGRGYSQVVVSSDADESARSAAAVLSWELRHASMASDVLLTFASDSLVLRSVQGVGVVCGKSTTPRYYAIWKNGGSIESTADDTAMVYRPTTSSWRGARIDSVVTPASMGMSTCSWTTSRTPDVVVRLKVTSAADTAGIVVGSPLRAYRRVTYKTFYDAASGRYWLGRRVTATSGAYERLTGPLDANGLSFTYYTATGAIASPPTAANVASVGFTVRTQSYRQYFARTVGPTYRADSLTTRIAFRK